MPTTTEDRAAEQTQQQEQDQELHDIGRYWEYIQKAIRDEAGDAY